MDTRSTREIVMPKRYTLIFTQIGLLFGLLLGGYLFNNYFQSQLTILQNPDKPGLTTVLEFIKNSNNYINTARTTVTLLSLAFFLVVILIPQLFGTLSFPFTYHDKWSSLGIISGILAVSILLVAWAVYTDPRGYYGTGHFQPRLTQRRAMNLEVYESYLNNPPDLIIFGSSRANTVDPAYIENVSGLVSFNASIPGGTPEYGLALFKYWADKSHNNLPSVIFLETSAPLSSGSSMRWSPIELIPYMRWATMRDVLGERLEMPFDGQHLAEGILVYESQTKYQIRREKPLEANGVYARPNPDKFLNEDAFQRYLERDIAQLDLTNCEDKQLHPVGIASLEGLIELAHENNSAVVIYTTPYHPDFVAQRITPSPDLVECMAIFQAYMTGLAQKHEHVFFLDYSLPESFSGTVDHTGFSDSHHLTWANNDRLIDAALPTIQTAYQWARQARGERK